MPEPWRLISDPPLPGAANMARDEAILAAVAAGQAPPTLRLYGWARPCLSLGRFQAAAVVDEAACARDGADWLRRPTGGRAVLHADELTYSLAAPEAALGGGSVAATHQRIALALQRAFTGLGLAVERAVTRREPGGAGGRPGACFAASARDELCVAGRKLVGSAQRRLDGALLEHGAIPLAGDPGRIARYLHGLDETDAATLRTRATTLAACLGQAVSPATVRAALAAGFAAEFGVALQPGTLSPWECEQAQRLSRTRYRQDAWNRSARAE